MSRLIQQNGFLVFLIVVAIIFITFYIISKGKKEIAETIVREFYALGTIIRLSVFKIPTILIIYFTFENSMNSI